jgi:hypothetical protein
MLLYLFGNASTSVFAPIGFSDNILTVTASAPIINAGWTLSISESTAPLTLGTASGPGSFGCLIGPGLSCDWPGIATPEPAALGLFIAQNNSVLLYLASGAAPGVVARQSIQLWNDQDTSPTRRCQIVFTRLLTYGFTATQEILSLKTSTLNALIDRPVLATSARLPANFLNGSVDFVSSSHLARPHVRTIAAARHQSVSLSNSAEHRGQLRRGAPRAAHPYKAATAHLAGHRRVATRAAARFELCRRRRDRTRRRSAAPFFAYP